MSELNRRTAMFNRVASTQPDLAIDASSQVRLVDLRIDAIEPDPGNPRRHFDQAKLNQFAASIKKNGLLQPIVVRPGEGAGYFIVMGERRWRACRIAGHVSIKAIIRPSFKDAASLLFAQVVENEEREALTTGDMLEAVNRWIADGIPQKDIAEHLSVDPARISRIKALADLPPDLSPLLDVLRVDPLYELFQHWKRDDAAVRALLDRHPEPTRAAIRSLGKGAADEATPNTDRPEAKRPVDLAPAQLFDAGAGEAAVRKAEAVASERKPTAPAAIAVSKVTVRVRHDVHGEGRVMRSPSIVADRLPVLFNDQDDVIQAALAALTILAVE